MANPEGRVMRRDTTWGHAAHDKTRRTVNGGDGTWGRDVAKRADVGKGR